MNAVVLWAVLHLFFALFSVLESGCIALSVRQFFACHSNRETFASALFEFSYSSPKRYSQSLGSFYVPACRDCGTCFGVRVTYNGLSATSHGVNHQLLVSFSWLHCPKTAFFVASTSFRHAPQKKMCHNRGVSCSPFSSRRFALKIGEKILTTSGNATEK